MKKAILKTVCCIAVLAVTASLMCACQADTSKVKETTAEQTTNQTNKTEKTSPKEKHRLIIDTDTGADDSAALILAAKQSNAEILGVTVLAGNVDLEQGAKNALMALETAGCTVPVYKGSNERFEGETIEAFSVFGKDGMGETDIIHPKGTATDGDAVDFIINTVKENPGEIEIVALGPATNIAKAIQKDPETMKQTKMIWSMGTAGLGPGNASPVAEFNVYADAPAYKVMLDSEIPITVIGLDSCDGEAKWTDEQFEELLTLNDTGKFVAKSFGKIRQFYADNGSEGSVMNCDAIAMMCVLYPDFIKDTWSCHGSCITDKGETFAQVLFYKEGFTYDVVSNDDFVYNVKLVTDLDKKAYFENFKNAISD